MALIRNYLARGSDLLLTMKDDGNICVGRPEHIRGREGRDFDAAATYMGWEILNLAHLDDEELAEGIATADAIITDAVPEATQG